MPLPPFTSPTAFPTFATLPTPQDPDPTSPDGGGDEPWYLLAEIKDDMTITKPTLVCLDRAGSPFALVFDGLERDGLDLKALGLRKGACVVVPRARRTPPKDASKRGFVSVARGTAAEVRAVPAPLRTVVEVAEGLRAQGPQPGCAGCGSAEGALARCTGCGGVRYCSKACQVKGWSEGGHKGDCKVIKAIRGIWGDE
ncbi:hypothetical protein B0H67DRAFT_200772 [Lasiosphaeris hirsuta]|uniref:MYND-type domain-containing protein n=1 Tax=Lasiosphaeris hirsuta TaxID=260670 RepID=A0AA40ARP8_9PEZI|nr:hypothetical protein B0H67DRAFT_200772 [Lasiosphaeris hirsuta]